jgi:hypothetical protein
MCNMQTAPSWLESRRKLCFFQQERVVPFTFRRISLSWAKSDISSAVRLHLTAYRVIPVILLRLSGVSYDA